MKRTELALLRDSYAIVQEMPREVALLFYGRLFDLVPGARALFHVDIREQARKLMETLDAIMESVGDWEAVRPKLRELGARHVTYGALPEHYKAVNTALLWTLGQALGPDFTPEVRQIWTRVLEAIAAEMLEGAAVVAQSSANAEPPR